MPKALAGFFVPRERELSRVHRVSRSTRVSGKRQRRKTTPATSTN